MTEDLSEEEEEEEEAAAEAAAAAIETQPMWRDVMQSGNQVPPTPSLWEPSGAWASQRPHSRSHPYLGPNS